MGGTPWHADQCVTPNFGVRLLHNNAHHGSIPKLVEIVDRIHPPLSPKFLLDGMNRVPGRTKDPGLPSQTIDVKVNCQGEADRIDR